MNNQFKPTDKKVIATDPTVMKETIGRDASPYKKHEMPVFEEDLKTTWTKGIAFMHTVKKCGSKLFSI